MKKITLMLVSLFVLLCLAGCSLFSNNNLGHSLVSSLSQQNTSVVSSGTISVLVPDTELANSLEKTLLTNNQKIPYHITLYKNGNQDLTSNLQLKMQDKLYSFNFFQNQEQQFIGDEQAWTPIYLNKIQPLYTFLFDQEEQKNWLPFIFKNGLKVSKQGEVELKDEDDTFSTTAYHVSLDQNQFNSLIGKLKKQGTLANTDLSNEVVVHKGDFTLFKEDNFIRAIHYDLEFSVKTKDEQTISFQIIGDSVFRFYDSNPSPIKMPIDEPMYPSLTDFLSHLLLKSN